MTNTNGGSSSVPTTAGRTNYGKWEKIATDLVADHEREEEAEAAAASAELGHDKYARSRSEAEEREKAAKVEKTKQMLDDVREWVEGNITEAFEKLLDEIESLLPSSGSRRRLLSLDSVLSDIKGALKEAADGLVSDLKEWVDENAPTSSEIAQKLSASFFG